MPRYKDEPPAVRVYTVCDESKYLIVRNVPALGCGDELKQLFATYGEVEECKPMDAEDCEPFTDVYWIKFRLISNARFAKRKLDESVFLGNRLQVSYALDYESLSDTKEKLEARRKEVLARIKHWIGGPDQEPDHGGHSGRSSSSKNQMENQTAGRPRGYKTQCEGVSNDPLSDGAPSHSRNSEETNYITQASHNSITRVSSDQDYFPSQSMNETVRRVREKLDKIESSSSNVQSGPASKKMRADNRRRI